MDPTNIKSRRAAWQMLTLGSPVWAPFVDDGWRAATIIGLGKSRGHRTVAHLSFETGGKARRLVGELCWRKPELKGNDKPKQLLPLPRPARVLIDSKGYRAN